MRAALCLCLGLALLIMPGDAEAKRGFAVINRSLQLDMSASASNGYDLHVSTRGHHRVTLTVSRPFERSATYTTHGRVSRNRIEADFGRLGRIDVHFRPRSRSHSQFPGFDVPDFLRRFRYCRGRKPVLEFGRFEGTIRFRGEDGFTQLHAKSASGAVDREYRRVCKRKRRSGDAGDFDDLFDNATANYLLAVDRSPRHVVVFESVSFDFGPGLGDLSEFIGTLIAVVVRERHEGMRIERFSLAEGDAGSLLVSPKEKNPITATVTPPKPFHGTADFEKAKGTPPTWTGTLRASVPGAGVVWLTGEDYRATFCRISLNRLVRPRTSRCLRRSGAPLPGPFVVGPAIGAQIKGSQSQAFGDARLSWSR